MKNLAKEINEAMLDGIRNFGEYSFFDKGAGEVMDTNKYNKKLRALSGEDAMTVIKELESIVDDKYRQEIMEQFVLSNDSWDEFWEADTEFCEKYY